MRGVVARVGGGTTGGQSWRRDDCLCWGPGPGLEGGGKWCPPPGTEPGVNASSCSADLTQDELLSFLDFSQFWFSECDRFLPLPLSLGLSWLEYLAEERP